MYQRRPQSVQAGWRLYEQKGTQNRTQIFKNFKWLTTWHIVAAVLHGLSFLAILIAFLVTGPKFESILTKIGPVYRRQMLKNGLQSNNKLNDSGTGTNRASTNWGYGLGN